MIEEKPDEFAEAMDDMDRDEQEEILTQPAPKPETKKYAFVTRIRVDLNIEVEAESEEDARKQAEIRLDEEVTDTAMGGFGFVGTSWTTGAHHRYNIASKGPVE